MSQAIRRQQRGFSAGLSSIQIWLPLSEVHHAALQRHRPCRQKNVTKAVARSHAHPPQCRRQFITQLDSAVAISSTPASASNRIDENLIAVLNDTHIGAQQTADSPIQKNLHATIDRLLAPLQRPDAFKFMEQSLALCSGRADTLQGVAFERGGRWSGYVHQSHTPMPTALPS
jgi:hypothetical protein